MDTNKPRLVGLNHVALEIGDVEEALRFYASVFTFELRGTHKDDQGRTAMAFIDLGDQFLALMDGREQAPDTGRHFGLVVDDRDGVMAAAQAAGAAKSDRPFNFVDPWGQPHRDRRLCRRTVFEDGRGAPDHGADAWEEPRRPRGAQQKGDR